MTPTEDRCFGFKLIAACIPDKLVTAVSFSVQMYAKESRRVEIMYLMSLARVLLIAFALPCFAQHVITPKSLIARIDKDGAKEVVKQLNMPNDKEWNWVMDRIEGGSAEWLEVADKLSPGTDGGASEDLEMVVARALVHNPNGVLKMTGETWKLERVCGDYEIEEPAAKARKRKADVRLAMKRVVAPDLQEKRKECLMTAEKEK